MAKLQGPGLRLRQQRPARADPHHRQSLHKATNDLDRLVNEVERDPRGFINKPPAKQIQVKP